jgi:EAL domain-containing protein (putative c-di-GMP-specific phosphodiesterase class I)
MAPPARPTRPTWSRPSPHAPSPVAAALAEARLQHGDRTRAIRDAVADVLAEGAVEVGFQPVVALATGDVVGYEALARGPRGTPLERPDRLFAAARAAGRLDELDWLCQRLALRAALDAGLRAGQVLFLNVEPDASGFMPLELRALYAQATTRMTVAVEVTERALTERPAALLGHVADMRALGCAVALDDVGAAAGSLAMLPVLAPDVVKLDLHLLLEVDEQVFGDVVGTVAAQAERTGALVLVERIEQEGQVAMARALGAELAQGWLYGRRLLLEQAPEPPEADRVVPATV